MGIRKSRKRHGAAFRAQVALAALRGDRTIGQLTSQFGVHATLIYKWKRELLAGAEGIFTEPGKGPVGGNEAQFEKEKGELFEQIGRLKMELEWVKKKLRVND
jgi:transposase-like protein